MSHTLLESVLWFDSNITLNSDDASADEEEVKRVNNDLGWQPGLTDYLLPPTLHGFSLTHKKWGELSVDRLQETSWSEKPSQHLVLPEAYRTVVKSLVKTHSSEKKDMLLSDVVHGKGSGCIVALYVNPGCGKVLVSPRSASRRFC